MIIIGKVVDEDKAQLFIKGSGFGLNDDGEGIIQLDTKRQLVAAVAVRVYSVPKV